MAVHSRMMESLVLVLAVVTGMPLVGTIFLVVLFYCCMEWLHDMLAAKESGLTEAVRPVESLHS
jgi:hypothetical protein